MLAVFFLRLKTTKSHGQCLVGFGHSTIRFKIKPPHFLVHILQGSALVLLRNSPVHFYCTPIDAQKRAGAHPSATTHHFKCFQFNFTEFWWFNFEANSTMGNSDFRCAYVRAIELVNVEFCLKDVENYHGTMCDVAGMCMAKEVARKVSGILKYRNAKLKSKLKKVTKSEVSVRSEGK